MRIAAGSSALRPLRDSDVPAIVAGLGDSEIARWLPNIPQPYTALDARRFIETASSWQRTGAEASFAIVGEDDLLLGVVGVRGSETPPTIGYWVAAAARGRGLATAATRALVGWAFEAFPTDRLALHAEAGNVASQRVAERSGFVRLEGAVARAGDRELWVFELRRAP